MVVLVLQRGFYPLYRAAGGCDNLIWWQCWYLGWCWPQCCWQSWQRARCHCLLTVDGIIQVLTIPTLLTLHHHHYPHLLLRLYTRNIWPFDQMSDQQAIRAQISHIIPLLFPSTYSYIHKYEQNGWGVFRVNNEIFIWEGNCTFDVGCCNTPIARNTARSPVYSSQRSTRRYSNTTHRLQSTAGHVRPTWQIKSIIHRHEYYQFLALDKVYNCIR